MTGFAAVPLDLGRRDMPIPTLLRRVEFPVADLDAQSRSRQPETGGGLLERHGLAGLCGDDAGRVDDRLAAVVAAELPDASVADGAPDGGAVGVVVLAHGLEQFVNPSPRVRHLVPLGGAVDIQTIRASVYVVKWAALKVTA